MLSWGTMLRLVSKQASQDLPVLAASSQTRGFISAIKLDFSEDVTSVSRTKAEQSIISQWSSTKSSTEQVMKSLQTYKDVADANKEPYLKFHNPRTFEDFNVPIPNFRKFGLKGGDVPKFFDNVLAKRAELSQQKKSEWWTERKKTVDGMASSKAAQFPTLPVPTWTLGKPIGLAEFERVTGAYMQSLEPKRKLRLPTMPAQVTDSLTEYAKSLKLEGLVPGLKETLLKAVAENAVVEENGKALPGFKFLSKAEAAKLLAARRATVHAKWVRMWAKRIAVNPEQALIPLNEVDHLIASNYQDFSPKYNETVVAVSKGSATYADKLVDVADTDNWFVRKERSKIKEQFPASDKDLEAAAEAKKLEDSSYALAKLLGPAAKPEGLGLRSAEVAALTQHLYTPDRYMYKEGMKLVERLKEEEAALAAQGLDVAAAQNSPATHVQALLDHLKNAEKAAKEFEAEKAKAEDAYSLDIIKRKEALAKDPSNIAFDDVLYPEIEAELFEIEMKELAEKEAMIEEAEEEELWLATLLTQARHVHQNIDFDLPQGVVGYMDPLLFKKIDFETTNGLDTVHKEIFESADSENGVYVKEQWGLENLSHHFLPLLRYRRKKYRQLYGFYEAEKGTIPPKSKPTAW